MKRKIGIQIFVYWRVWAEVKRALLSRILTLEILYWAVNAEDCALRDVRAGWESCRGAGVPYSPGHCDSARDNTCKSSETSHKGLHRIAKHIFIISIFPLNYVSSFCFIFFWDRDTILSQVSSVSWRPSFGYLRVRSTNSGVSTKSLSFARFASIFKI